MVYCAKFFGKKNYTNTVVHQLTRGWDGTLQVPDYRCKSLQNHQ